MHGVQLQDWPHQGMRMVVVVGRGEGELQYLAVQMTQPKEAWVDASSNQLPLVSESSPIVGAMGLQEESLEWAVSLSWVSGRVLVVNDFIPPGRSLGSIKALGAGS